MAAIYHRGRCGEVGALKGYYAYAFYKLGDLHRAFSLSEQIGSQAPRGLRFYQALVAFDTRHYSKGAESACALSGRTAVHFCELSRKLSRLAKTFHKETGLPMFYYSDISREDAEDLQRAMEGAIREEASLLHLLVPLSSITAWVMPDALFDQVLREKQAEAMSLNSHIFLRHPRDQRRAYTLSATIRHELVHAILYASLHAEIPTWLNEGLAQVISSEGYPESAKAALKKARQKGELYSLAQLGKPWEEQKLNLQLAYAESREVVRYLVEKWGYVQLQQYLELLRSASDSQAAFMAVFGMDFSTLLKQALGQG